MSRAAAPRDDTQTRLAERGALLLALLQRENHGLRTRLVAWGALHVLAAVLVAFLVLVGLAGLVPALPRPAGIAVGLLVWAVIALAIYRHGVRPLRAIPNLAVFARRVEERRDMRDMLRAALEWSQRGAPAGQSTSLVEATVDRAYEEAKALRLTQLFELPHRRRNGLVVLGIGAVIAILAAVNPGAPARALRGLALDWPTPADVQYGALEVLSGNPTVLAGGSAEVVVREHGPRAPEMHLRFNDTGDLWKSRVLEPRSDADPREYVFQFEDVRADLVYRFESGRRKTDEHRVTVVHRPVVSRLQLTLRPPAYTGRGAAVLEEGRGDAVALVGTRIEIEATASAPLASARVAPEGGPASAVTLSGSLPMQTASRTARASFLLRGDLRYHFELVDSLGNPNADPVSYQLSAIEDRPPYVEVRQPGEDAEIPKTLQVPIGIYAADDFGISRLTLVYRRERQEEDLGLQWQRRTLPVRGEGSTDPEGRALAGGPVPEVLHQFMWSLEDAGLYPGDWISYWVEVEDNDDFSGHKMARSNTYRLRLPSLSELYAELQEGDEKRQNALDDALDKSRELQQKYEKLARELKKNPESDWQKEKEIQSALEKQKEIAEQVQKIAEDLQKEVSKMQDQQLVSEEIAQKLDEIRKLMEQVQDETLREYMERLQEAMQQLSPEELQRAMEKMELSQEEFVKRLDRTKSLLEQLRREQKLDEMIERVSELLREQERMGDRTEEMQQNKSNESKQNKEGNQKDGAKETSEQLGKEQEDLAGKTDELQKELDELAKEAAEAGQQQLQEPNQQMQEQNPSGEMQEASKQLQQKQPQGAQPHQQNAEKSLRGLYEQLMQAQQQMSMSAQAEAAEKLAKAARQTLDVSFRQEGVAKQAPPQPDPAGHGESAQQQQALVAATGKIANDLDQLAKESLAAPPQVTALLGEAMRRMQEGTRAYEKGNPGAGKLQGEQAYGLLNKAVVELNRSAGASCPNPGNGQGSQQQQMQDTMGQQQRLNDMTRQLRQRLRDPSNPTPEERAEMGRLLGEQQAIQQQLEDVERKAAEQRQLLGRLDKMQQEMQEVVEDMQSEAITDETLAIQEKIVSRMLDAQRSLHKRDFNDERESRTAAEIFSRGGTKSPESERIKKLRRDIDRALREGTPEEYEDLVREYFRAISEEGGSQTPAPVP